MSNAVGANNQFKTNVAYLDGNNEVGFQIEIRFLIRCLSSIKQYLKTFSRKKSQKPTLWKKDVFMMNLTYLGFSGPKIGWSGTLTGRKLELKLENLHKNLFSGSLKPRLLKILIKALTRQQIGLHIASLNMFDILLLTKLTKVACRKIRSNKKNAKKCTKDSSSDTDYTAYQYEARSHATCEMWCH